MNRTHTVIFNKLVDTFCLPESAFLISYYIFHDLYPLHDKR